MDKHPISLSRATETEISTVLPDGLLDSYADDHLHWRKMLNWDNSYPAVNKNNLLSAVEAVLVAVQF